MSPKPLLLAAMFVFAMVSPSLATTALNPPAGAILDLNGLATGGGAFEAYTVDFTATSASTPIMFLFRDDNGQLLFKNPAVIDQTASSGNLLLNSNFAGGTYTSGGNTRAPVDWAYAATGNPNTPGYVYGSVTKGYEWLDGAANQGYDTISQTIATTIGDTYHVSFSLADNSGKSTFGEGGRSYQRDVLVYHTATPIPGTAWLLGSGLFGLIGLKRKYLG